ncbi:MAG: Holliday junction branch migration protein RuvA [Gammaproteobacteria bacterium]|nr:Holliday junction branch migration protein RuvA [Gammaproteobacteria bacterium]
MIGRIEGQLVEITDNVVLLAVGGVGYEVEVTHGVLAGLPGRDKAVRLYTHFVVREDAQQLYGFGSRGERDLFRVLIRISGVGPKLALALISSMTLAELASAVRHDDVDVLVRVPGVGRKKAERLLVELRDKLPETVVPETAPARPAEGVAVQEAERALVALGYRAPEAARLVASVKGEAEGTEAIVRAVLKRVAGQTETAS